MSENITRSDKELELPMAGDGGEEDEAMKAIDEVNKRIPEPGKSFAGKQKTLCRYPDYSKSKTRGENEFDGDETGVPATGEGAKGLEKDVWDALYDVEDPEMPVSIVDLGLIYGVNVEGAKVEVDMTLTYTGCPARNMLLNEVESRVRDVDGIEEVDLSLVFNPGWTIEMVTEEGKEALREFGLSVS